MARNGEFIDVIFFQALALTLSTDVVFIPVFGESACVNGMYTLIKGADIDKKSSPLFLGYFEESRFFSGHFQSIVPNPKVLENPVIEYLENTKEKTPAVDITESNSLLLTETADLTKFKHNVSDSDANGDSTNTSFSDTSYSDTIPVCTTGTSPS